jgi:hypothetical protein
LRQEVRDNCKTFIHRFDSDRRLQSTQQVRDIHKFNENLTVVKNVVNTCILLPRKAILQSFYILGNGVLVEERISRLHGPQLLNLESRLRPKSAQQPKTTIAERSGFLQKHATA